MIRLFASGGSQEIDLVGRRAVPELWARTRETAIRLLGKRGYEQAANLLLDTPFELWDGTNSFNDEFSMLYAELQLDRYLQLKDTEHDRDTRLHFQRIAKALEEVDLCVRFIAVSLSERIEPTVVRAPNLATTSESLERALAEVERSLAAGQPAAGVDRIHTALHAYLLGIADANGRDPGDLGLTDLLKVLRQSHPALQPTGPRAADITRILNAFGTVVDALNPLRNRASLAHPADELLPDAEAMLVINAVRTLFHYLEKRLQGSAE